MPTAPTRQNATVASAVAGVVNVDDVAAATLKAFENAFTAIAAGDAHADDARLVNWLLTNDHLLPPAGHAASKAFDDTLDRFHAERRRIEAQIPTPQYALALLDGSGENEWVHIRGDHKQLAEQPTFRRFLAAIDGQMQVPRGSGRLELAMRVIDPSNPLTPRVIVNRIWAHLTGQGIVKTVDNFGVLGDQPTHPELLDHLAHDFVESGWNMKQLIRRVVLSSTYRQSCLANERLPADRIAQVDPANQLLHRARVRRIPAEAVRDALLAVSGGLRHQLSGPSVPVYLAPVMRHNRSPKVSGPLDGDGRRSVYVEYRRNALNHFLAAFDKPQPSTTVGRRNLSNSAAQPLMLLNDPLVHSAAQEWGERLVAQHKHDAIAIRAAYFAAFGRPPSVSERSHIDRFLGKRSAGHEQAKSTSWREAAWTDLCLVLINNKEFIYLR